MANEPRRKLVVIEDGTLVSMAGNAAFLREFPFLTSLAQEAKPGGCGGCRAAKAKHAAVFGAAKAAFAGLSSERKRKLKEMLNAQQIRITYRTPAGKVIALTF